MDFNQIPTGIGYALFANKMSRDRFFNLSDDEKKEYIERNRSLLSDRELNSLTASLGRDEDDGPDFGNPIGTFRGPGIG